MQYKKILIILRIFVNVSHMRCPECNHGLSGKCCEYCKKKRRIAPCSDDDCVFCRENTLFTFKKACTEWHISNDVSPRMIWKNSSKIVKLKCQDCGILYERAAYRITKHGCALCSNKSERKLYDFLTQFGGIKYQVNFEWSKKYRYDFQLDNLCLVELDGPQHFCPIKTWKTGFDVYESDIEKEQLATTNGWSIIRILQKDVYDDNDEWKQYLKTSILSLDIDNPSILTPKCKEYTEGPYKRLRCDSFF